MKNLVGIESQMYALSLARLGLIKPGMTHEGMELSKSDDEILRDYVNMIRVQKYSPARALGLILTRYPVSSRSEAPPRVESELVAEIIRLRDHFDRFQQESKDLKLELDRERKESRERIRDLDEERKLSRLRVTRLEETLRRSKPVTLWERLRAAFGVVTGKSGVVPALPEWVERPENRKAA